MKAFQRNFCYFCWYKRGLRTQTIIKKLCRYKEIVNVEVSYIFTCLYILGCLEIFSKNFLCVIFLGAKEGNHIHDYSSKENSPLPRSLYGVVFTAFCPSSTYATRMSTLKVLKRWAKQIYFCNTSAEHMVLGGFLCVISDIHHKILVLGVTWHVIRY